MITKRSFVGLALWSFISNIGIAAVAVLVGFGFALILIYIEYGIIHRIPAVFEKWRRLVIGKEVYAKLPVIERKWPTRAWWIGSAIFAIFTLVVLIKFNVRLIEIFDFR